LAEQAPVPSSVSIVVRTSTFSVEFELNEEGGEDSALMGVTSWCAQLHELGGEHRGDGVVEAFSASAVEGYQKK
jgi:hypothetical protein